MKGIWKIPFFVVLLLCLMGLNVYAEEQKEGDDEKNDIAWFTLAPKLGGSYFPKQKKIDKDMEDIDPRMGFHLELEIALGGDGLNFVASPYFDYQKVDSSKMPDEFKNWMVLGAFLGPEYRMHFGQWYPHIGLGFRGGYIINEKIDYGCELYGLIPIGITYYVLEDLGIIVEIAGGYGAVGYKPKDIANLKDIKGIKFAHGLGFQATVGIRWP